MSEARVCMFATKRGKSLGLAAVPVLLALLGAGCSSSSNNSNSLSPAQAQAVSAALSQAALQGFGNGVNSSQSPATGERPSLSGIVPDLHPDASPSCTSTSSGESCDFLVSYTGPCTDGGSIAVAGNIDGTLDNNGTGSIAAQITLTPANCLVSGLTLNGDPDVTIDGQIGFTSNNVVYPVVFTEGGAISYGPHPSETCQINVTETVNSLTSCTISGTVCGQTVSGSC